MSSSQSSIFARISKIYETFIAFSFFHGMLSLSMKWKTLLSMRPVSKAWQPSARSARETKEVMKQPTKVLVADVGQDDRVRGRVESEAAGCVKVHSWNSLS